MLKKEKEIKNEKLLGKLILCIVVFLILIILAFSSKEIPQKPKVINTELINSLFEKIEDNYTLDIKIITESKKELSITTDSKIKMYDGDFFNGKKYLKYNDIIYEFNENKSTLTKVKDNIELDNPYYNVNLIKNIIKYCNYEYVDEKNTNCKIKLQDYINEYNKIFEEDREPNLTDEYLTLELSYSDLNIKKINIDYTNVDEESLINGDSLKYEITLFHIGENNYDDIYSYFKKYLES